MNVMQVQYTVKESYVETNKDNITRVMNALRERNNPNIKYSSFVLEDGKTFVHLVMRTSKDVEGLPASLPEFQHFRQSLLNSEPEAPPQQQLFDHIDSSWDIF